MRLAKKFFLVCLTAILLIFLPFVKVYAILEGQTPGGTIELVNPIKATTLAGLLSDILSIIVQIGIPIIVIMVIFTGFSFVMARGNKSELENAKKALVGVLVGSAIVIGAYAISSAIKNTVCQLQTGTGASSSQCP